MLPPKTNINLFDSTIHPVDPLNATPTDYNNQITQTDFIFISTDFFTALQPFLQPFLQLRPRCGSSSFAEKSEIVKKYFG